MNPKVGILTMFYSSNNYGGCLQAYALANYLNSQGIEAEQINLRHSFLLADNYKRIISLDFKTLCEKARRRIKQIAQNHIKCDDFKDELLQKRYRAFSDFRNNYVPSSTVVYDYTNIETSCEKYDAFIVGSDQVWNEVTINSPYLLNFIDSRTKLKISYAASIAQSKLSDYAKDVFRRSLSDYLAISVREKTTANQLSHIIGRKVEWVLDPTFLLNSEEWTELCEPIDVDYNYIFCYFLGDDIASRKLATAFAAERKLRIITLPYLQNKPRKSDRQFGDVKLWDISPLQFLYLINKADYVFTDSFHACVFSYIFKREFYPIARKEGKTNSRITDLLDLLDIRERFIEKPRQCTVSKLNQLNKIDYSIKSKELQTMQDSSKMYLFNNIVNRLTVV